MGNTSVATPDRAALPLRLQRIAGPEIPGVELDPSGGQFHIGRATTNDLVLPDASVSRRHALFVDHEGTWYLSDVGSRHGTVVNGVRIRVQDLVPLSSGDLISLGPWTFLISIGATASSLRTGTVEVGPETLVEAVEASELDSLAQRRLGLLIDVADAIQSAKTELELAGEVLRAALAGTGFANAAIVRAVDASDDLEVLGFLSDADETGDNMVFSQTLIRRAREGEFVRLSGDQMGEGAPVSIIQHGITSAMCAPIRLGSQVSAMLYVDSRGLGAEPRADAAAFCQAVARLCGLALSNLKRQDLERRQRDFEREFESARRAQQLIMPPPRGELRGAPYALRTEPGRMVAGDLVDVFELDDGRAVIVLGDVASKGVGAAMLMATTQAHLHASLRAHGDLARAVKDVNTHLYQRTAADRFVSLWIGVVDPVTRRLGFVDAGHGLWAIADGDHVERPESQGGIVLGVEAEPPTPYVEETLELGAGARVVVFSDGVVEQRNPEGEMFGIERVFDLLRTSSDCASDADSLFNAVDSWAGEEDFADDTSILSVCLP